MRVRRPYRLQLNAPEISTVPYQRGGSHPVPACIGSLIVSAVHNHLPPTLALTAIPASALLSRRQQVPKSGCTLPYRLTVVNHETIKVNPAHRAAGFGAL